MAAAPATMAIIPTPAIFAIVPGAKLGVSVGEVPVSVAVAVCDD